MNRLLIIAALVVFPVAGRGQEPDQPAPSITTNVDSPKDLTPVDSPAPITPNRIEPEETGPNRTKPESVFPKVTIEGDRQLGAPELGELRVTTSNVKRIMWRVSPSDKKLIDWKAVDSGKRIVFATKKTGVYRFEAIASSPSGELTLETHEVEVIQSTQPQQDASEPDEGEDADTTRPAFSTKAIEKALIAVASPNKRVEAANVANALLEALDTFTPDMDFEDKFFQLDSAITIALGTRSIPWDGFSEAFVAGLEANKSNLAGYVKSVVKILNSLGET